jgi:hypothetical protein
MCCKDGQSCPSLRFKERDRQLLPVSFDLSDIRKVP